jgi:hypothetical protein
MRRQRLAGANALRGSVSAVALAWALAACAGGGGGGGAVSMPNTPGTNITPAPAPPAPVLTPESYRTAEYNLSWALEAIHAAEAYAQGYSGNGITIGFVDFNFELGSGEVRYDNASRGPQAQAVQLYTAQTRSTPSPDTHGHAVAVIAAGVKNELGIHGVAFDARVLAVDFFAMVNETQETVSGKRYHVSDPWTYLTQGGVRIISKSFGYDTGDIISNPPVVSEYYVVDSAAIAVQNGAFLVSSAGNNSGANPILSNMDTIDDLRAANALNGPGAFVIAGAVDRNNQIASFSNRAGTARDDFIVAPGVAISAPYNGSVQTVSGTSISAPIVAGAAAVVLQRWPSLTARQLADVLFASATDLGAPGVDAVYGHGLLNLNAALQPVGVTTMAVPSGAPALASSGLVLGAAFGDAPAFRMALRGSMVLDRFGRDFTFDASRLAGARPASLPLAGLLRRQFFWHGAQYDLGTGTVSFQLRDDAAARLVSANGLEAETTPQTIVQFAGSDGGIGWMAGSGLALTDALAPERSRSFAATPLTRAFATVLDQQGGSFAALRVTLDPGTTLSFGVSQANDVIGGHPVAALREGAPARAAALRLDRVQQQARFAFELGTLVEDDAVLGTLSSGGLRLTERSATVWNTLSAEWRLAPQWSAKTALTLAVTDPGSVRGSVFSSLGTVLSTGASLGIAGQDIFAPDDVLGFTVTQPLHVETAAATLVSATARDVGAGVTQFATNGVSLAPSGRELALESSYRFALGVWTAEAALAYRFDAGHRAGLQDAAAILSISRGF